jgi:DNA-directed RNA polymerase specialized sigma24 family protein
MTEGSKPGSFAAQLTEMALCLEELTAARTKLIHKRRKQGASLRQIAEEARISHTAVANILAR